MSTQLITQQVRWQDLKVKSEVDVVLEIADREGWEDCEIFGYGDMITQPHESKGWKLIPADLYKYSIPPQAIARLHRIINAGVRVQGAIIADDEQRREIPPTPARPKISLPSATKILSFIGRVLAGLGRAVSGLGRLMVGLGSVLIRLICIAGVMALISLFAFALIHFTPIVILGLMVLGVIGVVGSGVTYDPKLIILVDDGKGGTVWVSLFTWYE